MSGVFEQEQTTGRNFAITPGIPLTFLPAARVPNPRRSHVTVKKPVKLESLALSRGKNYSRAEKPRQCMR
jgi:hypothetical protein